MVHSVVLLLTLLLLMPYAAMIPMPAIAAILFMVAYNMSGWRTFTEIVKTSPKSDVTVLVLTFSLTVVFDLVVAIAVGLILASLLFLSRMADVAEVKEWTYLDDYEEGKDNRKLKPVPAHTMVFEITGPMFFAAADKILEVPFREDKKAVILRMRSVPAMDITALNSLRKLNGVCRKNGIRLMLSHVNEQPMRVMEKAGFRREIGGENFFGSIDEALEEAERIVG